MPRDRVGLRLKRRLARVLLTVGGVSEHVSRMVQNDIQDDVNSSRMRGVDEPAEFGRSGGGGCAESRLDIQKILNAVTVKTAGLVLAVLQHRRQPQRSDTEGFQIIKLPGD